MTPFEVIKQRLTSNIYRHDKIVSYLNRSKNLQFLNELTRIANIDPIFDYDTFKNAVINLKCSKTDWIGFHLLGGHADAVVGDRERSVFLVAFDADEEISALHADILIGQRAEAELVDSVRGVGDQLAQKDLLMRVDGIDHQLQQPPGFRLKFFFRHIFILRMLWTLSRP